MVLWHYMKSKHLDEAYSEGLQPGLDGVIYFCPTIEGCEQFAAFYGRYQQVAGDYEYAFLQIDIDPKDFDVRESHDHSEALFKTKAYLTEKAIPAEFLPKREEIQYRTYHSNGYTIVNVDAVND